MTKLTLAALALFASPALANKRVLGRWNSQKLNYCVDDAALVRFRSAPVGGVPCDATTSTACNCLSTECFFIQKDPDHCGADCISCVAGTNAIATCEDGVCGNKCLPYDSLTNTAYCDLTGTGDCVAVTLSGGEPLNAMPVCTATGTGWKCARGYEYVYDNATNTGDCVAHDRDEHDSED